MSKKKASATSPDNNETHLINFSFTDHKSEYRDLLINPQKPQSLIVEDLRDFWIFISKYENTLRNIGQPILNRPLKETNLTELQPYHKRKHISFILHTHDSKRKDERFHKSENKIPLLHQQFQEIILTYLDFKQKEKFNKIKKLRSAQKNLPIARFKKELFVSLNESRVVMVAGDTGCGKSTQVPQYLYKFGYRSIACTQPRRLACVSLSKRVAHEMLESFGTKVGFQIRFEKYRSAKTNILFITEGLLLRQLSVETNLDQYDVLILDEIHERNLFGDFLLGVVKCLLRAQPKLKIILMSATINVELFLNYFEEDGAKLIRVPGRLYSIKTVFMPPPALDLKSHSKSRDNNKSNRLDPAPFVQVLSLIDQKYLPTDRGDVLIFVSGVNEITTICDSVKEYAEQNSHWIILPLHSGLALADQDKVFDYAPNGMRKCIVSTNIAETSLTVDGVRFVIDSGKMKEMSYDASCKGQRLKEFWVSKSSAEQRKGRAGRTGPGICYRLYSEKQYDAFEDYQKPEIFRVPLDTILLQMIAMGLPDVRIFPFIESPEAESIEQTILALKQHNALKTNEKITPLGQSLSNLPVELTVGKLLLMGCVFPDMEKILTLAAVMSVQNPFTNRAYTDKKCEREREYLESDQGDVFTLLRAFNEWLNLKMDRENTRKWCYKLGIEEQRLYEIAKLRNQFQNILVSCNMTTMKSEDQLTSGERARRHGEMRMLKSIKRKQNNREPRQRKILKSNADAFDNNFDGDNDDIRDVDFRLLHDTAKMEILYRSSKLDKLANVLLLKLIIVSGFYPQIAISDEFNYCKGGTQQFFHTFLKPFISIHPNAYFAKYFDVLKLNDSDILDKPDYYTPKQLLSKKHQLICYQNLLETAKPYLMNCIRMPAAQTLLLFSYTIDTNVNITRIICDSWLCLDFPLLDTGQEILSLAIRLRRQWNNLLSNKLAENVNNVESQLNKKFQNVEEDMKTQLWKDLVDFMSKTLSYTIKRLLPGDLKTAYTNAPLKCSDELKINPFADDFDMTYNEKKGGINVTENVVYGCVEEVQWTIAMDAVHRQNNWLCPQCNQEYDFHTIEKKIIHKKSCVNIRTKDTINQLEISDNINKISEGREYHCSSCNKKLYLSKIDILKHKKYCNK